LSKAVAEAGSVSTDGAPAPRFGDVADRWKSFVTCGSALMLPLAFERVLRRYDFAFSTSLFVPLQVLFACRRRCARFSAAVLRFIG
jgi:hypothetical protein